MPVRFLQHAGAAEGFLAIRTAFDARAGEFRPGPRDAVIDTFAGFLGDFHVADGIPLAGPRDSGAKQDVLAIERAAFDFVALGPLGVPRRAAAGSVDIAVEDGRGGGQIARDSRLHHSAEEANCAQEQSRLQQLR